MASTASPEPSRTVAALLVALLGLTLSSCALFEADSVTASVRTGPLPSLAVVVDTDMHPDDWLALIYLASEPGVEIRAVTVEQGAGLGCDTSVAIARDLLAEVGEGHVPVACGPPPAPGGIPFPDEIAAEIAAVAARLGWTPDDGDPPGAPTGVGDAVALLRAAVDHGPLTIVSLGPPTNVARLLDDPTWDRRNVARIVQMAGAVDVPGNVESLPTVEWNAAVAPAALATVLSTDLEVVLVSLDGTNSVPIETADIDRITADRSTPAAAIAAQVLDSQRAFAASGGFYLWDLLASMAARQPDVVRVESIPVRVSLDAGEAGRTVRDPAGREIPTTVEADAEGFERIFLEALLGRAR
jgi:inosine-uridine nucleoside N-ribohydrolase